MTVTVLPRYVAHTVPTASPVFQFTMSTDNVSPSGFVSQRCAADAAIVMARWACYFVRAMVKVRGSGPCTVGCGCCDVDVWMLDFSPLGSAP